MAKEKKYRVPNSHRNAVKAFNERMAAAQRGGYTWIEGYQSFEKASQMSDYRMLFGRSASGNLKLRTDFSRMTEAEIEAQQRIMDRAVELGTTRTEASQVYEDVFGSEPEEGELEAWSDEINSIKEDSYRRFYYVPGTKSNPGHTTIAVDMGVTKYEALTELVKLKKEHESPTNPGYIYASAIDEHLKQKYMT